MLRRRLFYATLERARAGRLSPDRGLITNPRCARFSGPRPARPAPSATRSPRDPFGDAYSPPRAIPWADLLAAPFTTRSKVSDIKTGESGWYVP